MAYNRINWEDKPSTATPINADNLNKMDSGIKELEDGKIAKADIAQTDQVNNPEKVPSSAVTHALGQQVTALNNNLAKALTVAEYLNSPYGSGNSVKSSTVIVSGGGLWLVFITCGLGSTSATTGCYLVKMQFTGKIITPITEVPGISVSLDETGLSAGGAKLVITNTSGGKSIDVSLIKVGK